MPAELELQLSYLSFSLKSKQPKCLHGECVVEDSGCGHKMWPDLEEKPNPHPSVL